MAEEAATATDTAESVQTDAEKKPEGAKSEGNDTQLGPEGEKALAIWKSDAKKAKAETKGLQERLDKIEESNKSETEKAIDKARKEGKVEAESGFEKERRSDRLQVAVARHARELADVDDVVLNLTQGDTDDLFDGDGKVAPKALESALDALLRAKPHLKASGAGKPQGSADGGEGASVEGTSFNDLIRGKT